MSSPFTTRLDGPDPEHEISRDILSPRPADRPAAHRACAARSGVSTACSAHSYGVAIVLVNFVVSAALITYTARISLGLMMGATLFGYLLRLGLILVAVLLVRDAGWISLPALGLTIIVTHLGLLIWELRYVSASLAFPGLKPTRNACDELR